MTLVATPGPTPAEQVVPDRNTGPRRVRPSLLALLAGTAVLYLWRLGDSGWANAYYSAAAQAGAQSWKALFFGSTDAANSITVDKTPASIWLMALSARIFGVNPWSVLVPQALAGVASVGLLYAAVRRWFSPGAALLSGAVLALTPVAVLMFRFNNPDALLVLLMVAGAYCTVRATENASARWLMLAGAAVGFAFLTKMLQAFLVLPAFAGVYLLAAPASLRHRVGHLAAALTAVIVSAGWWIAAVELWPSSSRPFIGGSQGNSVLELTLGYNGFGRLTGNEVGSVGGSPAGGWGSTGWSRLLGGEMGSQIAWLLPAAVVLLMAVLWVSRGTARTDRTRAAMVLWGGWLVVTAGVFSCMNGIIHPYYTVALAPAVAALVGVGSAVLWQRRSDLVTTATLSGALGLTCLQCCLLLVPYSSALAVLVLMTGLLAAAGMFAAGNLPRPVTRLLVPVALIAALTGPFTYSVATAATAHSGAIPSAGPASLRRFGPGGGGAFRGGGRGGGMVGLLNATTPGAALTELLTRAGTTWAAATVGSNNAAGYQLAAGAPVMAVGGFNGTDPAPTLAQFQDLVRSGRIRYFLGGAGMSGNSGSDAAQQIANWVAQTRTASTVDGVTVYDLTT
jgi:4-amino-4-deoxy-L-arabinose transferase-like glycosyltransferase